MGVLADLVAAVFAVDEEGAVMADFLRSHGGMLLVFFGPPETNMFDMSSATPPAVAFAATAPGGCGEAGEEELILLLRFFFLNGALPPFQRFLFAGLQKLLAPPPYFSVWFFGGVLKGEKEREREVTVKEGRKGGGVETVEVGKPRNRKPAIRPTE